MGTYACGPTYIKEGHTYHDVHMLGAQLSVQGEEENATTQREQPLHRLARPGATRHAQTHFGGEPTGSNQDPTEGGEPGTPTAQGP